MPRHSRTRGAKRHVDGNFTCALAALACAGLFSALIDATLGWSWVAGAVMRQLTP